MSEEAGWWFVIALVALAGALVVGLLKLHLDQLAWRFRVEQECRRQSQENGSRHAAFAREEREQRVRFEQEVRKQRARFEREVRDRQARLERTWQRASAPGPPGSSRAAPGQPGP